MKEFADWVGLFLVLGVLWFLVDPHGMGETMRTHIGKFNAGLSGSLCYEDC